MVVTHDSDMKADKKYKIRILFSQYREKYCYKFW